LSIRLSVANLGHFTHNLIITGIQMKKTFDAMHFFDNIYWLEVSEETPAQTNE
jgi:hypothetical protein